MRRPAGSAKRREDKGKIERQQLDHIRKIVFVLRVSAGRVFSDAMAQPKIGTTGLKGTPQQIILGTAHTSGVRLEEEPRLFRDARPLKTHFRLLSTTFCTPAGIFFAKQRLLQNGVAAFGRSRTIQFSEKMRRSADTPLR
jgi:hypothetical protein